MFLLTSQLPGKSEDFLGHMSSQGCSRCKKSFSSVDGLDFSGFDRENWIPRTSNEHKHSAKRTLDETSYTAQQKLCSHLGARYSVLQEQDYFDCIRYFVVDLMHNLYLGTAKHMMKNVWLNDKNEFLSDEDFERIQELVDSMTVPPRYWMHTWKNCLQLFRALQQISGKIGQLFILCLPSREFSLKTTLSVGAILSLLVSFWERKFWQMITLNLGTDI